MFILTELKKLAVKICGFITSLTKFGFLTPLEKYFLIYTLKTIFAVINFKGEKSNSSQS